MPQASTGSEEQQLLPGLELEMVLQALDGRDTIPPSAAASSTVSPLGTFAACSAFTATYSA
ncbi:hypothetical protein ACN28S_38210 [Cystobacter fuscus]